MAQFSTMLMELEVPDSVSGFELPEAVQLRLNALLDKQDAGVPLSEDERTEAEGLVDVAEFLSLIKLTAQASDAP